MELTRDKVGDVIVVTLQGEHLDAGNTKDFKQDVTSLVEPNAKVVLDLSRVQFVDSSGCGAILSFLRQLKAAGGDLKLCAVTKPVRSEELQQTLQRHLAQSAQNRTGIHAEAIVRLADETELVARLRELEQEIGSEAMQELIGDFLAETRRCMQTLRDALSRSDTKVAVSMLQALIDSSANLGAAELVKVCSDLQTAIDQDSTLNCTPWLAQLADAHRAVMGELDETYPAFRLKARSADPPYPVPAG